MYDGGAAMVRSRIRPQASGRGFAAAAAGHSPSPHRTERFDLDLECMIPGWTLDVQRGFVHRPASVPTRISSPRRELWAWDADGAVT